ncbi:MAG: DNA ligase [Oscillospiraceae bacterium]|nr:DNA ligase [Oscillospiraceae bacterium]MDE6996941.1 DNA ligase [Oscillospiraceae bacterium]
MLIAENVTFFADEAYLYEVKWDGERCIAFLDPKNGTELQSKRSVRMLPKVPELSGIHRQASKRCILDGELVCLANGKPEFSVIQRRSLLSDKYKIEIEAKRHPAVFIAFDCLYYDGRDLTVRPLAERREYLRKAVTDTDRLAVSRTYGADQALELYRLTRAQGLEGVVAKRKDSLYFQGKRTRAWLKMKHLMDDDFVVCGYIDKGNHLTSIVLGQYRGQELVYKGHVTLGVSGGAFAAIRAQPQIIKPPFNQPVPAGRGNEKAIWLEPVLVCTVEFMHRTPKGGMRQPVFKGLRWDKTPLECVERSENP